MTAALPPPVRVVVITGAPGAGKTETARRLVRRYQVPAALIDTDTVADVYPWRADERLYEVLGSNLRNCLATYREWGARVIVVSGVMLPGRSLDQFKDLIDDPSLEWVFYGLRAGPEELAARIRADAKVQDAEGRLAWSHLDGEVPSVPGIRLIDTRARKLGEVVDLIAASESADLPAGTVSGNPAGRTGPRTPAPLPRPEPDVREGVAYVSPDEAAAVCRTALARMGFPEQAAARTAADLVAAEAAGMPSHGLLRVPEYAASIEAGHLDPSAVPRTSRTGPGALLVDGRRAPGATVREHLVRALTTAGAAGPAVVGLRSSGHLGRLSELARQVTAEGLALVGFVNYSGAGRKVAAAGAARGTWGTNPVVLGCPAPPGPPIIADMSTSVVAEGVVRAALLSGASVPPGYLIGPRGEPVTDPRLLYTDPPRAAILPAAGHKGHAWAAFAEVLAGAVAGAGHLGDPQLPGNGGLFIAFRVDALGRTGTDVAACVALIEERLHAAADPSAHTRPRLPGRGSRPARPQALSVPAGLWDRLRDPAGLADWTTVPRTSPERRPS